MMITSRRVIARASRHTRRALFSIARHYRSRRSCLNVYDPDISNVYDSGMKSFYKPVANSAIMVRFGVIAFAGEQSRKAHQSPSLRAHAGGPTKSIRGN
ncbi:MAG: hypothetical protein JO356_07910 [Acidobacteria bacterium]|nr:hypothetical protein [Acidobacteriota bacterium]